MRDPFTGAEQVAEAKPRTADVQVRIGREVAEVIAGDGEVPREEVLFFAEVDAMGLELFARAETPGLALVALGHELDRALAARGWER